jgi:hypothetical protein
MDEHQDARRIGPLLRQCGQGGSNASQSGKGQQGATVDRRIGHGSTPPGSCAHSA